MEKLLFQDATTENFHAMEKLILQTVHSFQKTHGNPYNKEETEDLFSVASLSFVKACKTYNPESGALSTWVRFCGYKDLITYYNKEYKNKQIRQEDYESCKSDISISPLFDVLDSLDEDAKEIVNIVLNTPKEIEEAVQAKYITLKKVRKVIEKYLISKGWKRQKVLYCFSQIQKAL